MGKKVEFVSITQLVLCVLTGIVAVFCAIGMFYNPWLGLFFVASTTLTYTIYKEKDW